MKKPSGHWLVRLWLRSLKFVFCCAFASFLASVPFLFLQMVLSMFLDRLPQFVTIAYYVIVFPLAFAALASHFGIRLEREEGEAEIQPGTPDPNH